MTKKMLFVLGCLLLSLQAPADGPVIIIGGGGDVEQNVVTAFQDIHETLGRAKVVNLFMHGEGSENTKLYDDLALELDKITAVKFNYGEKAKKMVKREGEKLIFEYLLLEKFFEESKIKSEKLKALYAVLGGFIGSSEQGVILNSLNLIKRHIKISNYELYTLRPLSSKNRDVLFLHIEERILNLTEKIYEKTSCPLELIDELSVLSQSAHLEEKDLVVSVSLEVRCEDQINYENLTISLEI